MEINEETSSHVSIGFPMGLALLVTLMLFICCFFCCCLHWDKLQSLFPYFSSASASASASASSSSAAALINLPPHQDPIQSQPPHFPSSHHKPLLPLVMMKQKQSESMPVVMPGDEVPKFIAIACPCHPPTDHESNITIHLHKKPPPPPPCFSSGT